MRNAHDVVKALQCLIAADSRPAQAIEIAIARGGPESAAARILKSWALTPESVSPEANYSYRELLQLAARQSLIAQIRAVQPMRRVPFATPVLVQNYSDGAGFVAEGGLIPAGSMSFDQVRLQSRKVGSIIPATREYALMVDGEAFVTADLTRAIAAAESLAFIGDDAGTDESPAGVLYGVTPGSGSNNPANDISALIDSFDGDLSTSAILTSPKNGVQLHAAGFETTGARGGELAGIAHVAHRAVPAGVVVIIDAARVLIADDYGLELAVSGSATLDLGDSSGAATGESVSMYQTNTVAYRALRQINWQAAPGSVHYLNSVGW
ncbi:phage major capsid protein [Pseudomonas sp.]|uniref:phage major capsid protein n=1 Tax=Pseudomonas sp. TaxID=306 RepID=UPI00273696FB|nr:phage major capsid protein [Pseudomonas sp.]MDP3816684.1 phage major capsid protein [Pseudomonas sp.]